MSAPGPTTLRADVDELGIRLGRIGAAAAILRGLSADARAGVRQDALLSLLDNLDRDLALTHRAVADLRARAREPER